MKRLIYLLTLSIMPLCWAARFPVSAQSPLKERKEFRNLTTTEWNKFVAAVKTLNTRPAPDQPSKYDQLVKIHIDNFASTHATALYFPFHRQFLLEFEKALQQIDSTVTVPYWQWTHDSQAPELSPIFSDTYLGGNGVPPNQEVTTGSFANWRIFYPSSHILTRDFDQGTTISAFASPELINRILTSRTYTAFRQDIESTPSGAVHNGIGGDMRTIHSPNDPIYWLHIAYVDKIWDDWQKLSPSNATAFDGTLADGSTATLSSLLPAYNVSVNSVMSTGTLGYKYVEFDPSVTPNRPPSISAATTTRTAGSPSSNAQIATVSDAEDAENTLNVTATPLGGSGVALSSLSVDTNGKVTANVATTCTATTSTFTLQVTDSGTLSATTTLTVTINANQLPVLSYPVNPGTVYGTGITVNPLTGPSDDVGVTSIVVQSITPTNPGGISVNNAGVVTVANNVPAGNYTVTIRANADCAFREASFTLGITKATPVITWSNPANITCNTPLGATQLNATTNVPGSFVYTPPAGTILGVGSGQTLSVNFTPTDMANYNNTSRNVTINIVDTTAPTLTLMPNIVLKGTNGSYQTVTMAQMVASVSDGCSTLSVNSVVIEKVTSDEPDDEAGNNDGKTTNDIVIAADCKSVQLRAERNKVLNGRVYVITLRVRDAAGNTTRQDFRVSAPIKQNGPAAVQDATAQTKTSVCP